MGLSSCNAHAKPFKASWYSHASLIKEGTRKAGEAQIMANGKRFNENALTCASRDYPLGTILRITNKANNRFVLVKVTDRIGYRFKNKRIDLSKKAFKMLSSLRKGIIVVEIERIV
jgi:rare lipoprotein A